MARRCAMRAAGRTVTVFVGTGLVVAATVEMHPGHKAASEFVDELVSRAGQACIRPQDTSRSLHVRLMLETELGRELVEVLRLLSVAK